MATLTISTPYKSGTLTSIGTGANGENTRLNTSGITWAAGDVGRCVMFTSGDAINETRKIVAQGTNYCDIDFAFGTFPILDSSGADTLSNAPEADDALAVSLFLDEVDDGTTLVKVDDNYYYQKPGDSIIVAAGVFIYDTYRTVRIDPRYWDLDGGLRLGDVLANGYTQGGCTLLLEGVSSSAGGFCGGGSAVQTDYDLGCCQFYGSTLVCVSLTYRVSLRLHSDSTGNTTLLAHMLDCRLIGAIAPGIGYSVRSLFYRCTMSSDPTRLAGGYCYPIGIIGIFGAYTISGPISRFALWNVGLAGADTIYSGVTFGGEDIVDYFIYSNSRTTGADKIYRLKNIDIDEVLVAEGNSKPVFQSNQAPGTGSIWVIFTNELLASVRDSDGALVEDYRLYIEDANGATVYNAVLDAGEDTVAVDYASLDGQTIAINTPAYLTADFDIVAPYRYLFRKYGFAEYEGTWDGKQPLTLSIPETAELPVVADESTALAYPFSYASGVFTLTGDVAADAIQKLYDFAQATFCTEARMGDAMPIVTADGLNFAFASGYSLDTAGYRFVDESRKLADVAADVTVSAGGMFEDANGAIWNVEGTLYYGRHVRRNVKAITGGANIAGAVVACWDSTGVERTYSAALVAGALETDADGNVEGYYCYKVGAGDALTLTEYVGAYGYQWSTIPITAVGSPIGADGAPETGRLVTDAFVTLSKSAALALTGITVDHAGETVAMGSNTYSQVQDNLKARQSRIADLEAGTAGYVSYYENGSMLAFDGTFYNALAGWTYTGGTYGATLKGGTLRLAAPGTFALALNSLTIDFAAAGTYDLRGSTLTGTIGLSNSSGGAVTVKLPRGCSVNNLGPTLTENYTIDTTIRAAGIEAGLYVIHNETTDVEVGYGAAGAGGISQAIVIDDADHNIGDTIVLKAGSYDGATASLVVIGRALLTASGADFLDVLESDTVYAGNGIVGEDVDGIAADYPNLQMDFDDADNKVSVQELYAWWVWNQNSTYDGLRNFAGGLVAEDSLNYRKVSEIVDWKLDNLNEAPLNIYGARLYSSDNTSLKATGTNPIDLDPDKAYLAASDVAAIAAAVLSAASAAPMAADVRSVRGQALAGVGTKADPWRPA